MTFRTAFRLAPALSSATALLVFLPGCLSGNTPANNFSDLRRTGASDPANPTPTTSEAQEAPKGAAAPVSTPSTVVLPSALPASPRAASPQRAK